MRKGSAERSGDNLTGSRSRPTKVDRLFCLVAEFLFWRFIVGHDSDWGFLFFMLFFVIIAWGIGIFLGVGLAAVVKRPFAEPYLYLTSQLAVILTIIVFLVKAIYTDGEHRRDFANVKDNRSFVNLEKL